MSSPSGRQRGTQFLRAHAPFMKLLLGRPARRAPIPHLFTCSTPFFHPQTNKISGSESLTCSEACRTICGLSQTGSKGLLSFLQGQQSTSAALREQNNAKDISPSRHNGIEMPTKNSLSTPGTKPSSMGNQSGFNQTWVELSNTQGIAYVLKS